MDLVVATREGLYCPAGQFHIDPWQPVERAVLTHAHGDHARPGSRHYLAAEPGAPVVRKRLGDISLQAVAYGERVVLNGVQVSLHPAGHVLGSAQVRIEHAGATCVVSGDYKLGADATCAPFEPLRCDTFITESTFGLPVYRWEDSAGTIGEINAWWDANARAGRPSMLFAYAFGKAQRVLASIDAGIGPIVCHGAVASINEAYRSAGVRLPATLDADQAAREGVLGKALVLAPPSSQSTPWLRRFGTYSDGFASGWMRLRGARRRRNVDRGFVLSDHADWPGLQQAIRATGASRVLVTHGYVAIMVRWLREQGFNADALDTEYGDEEREATGDPAPPAPEPA